MKIDDSFFIFNSKIEKIKKLFGVFFGFLKTISSFKNFSSLNLKTISNQKNTMNNFLKSKIEKIKIYKLDFKFINIAQITFQIKNRKDKNL
jgi:hypothetical protein